MKLVTELHREAEEAQDRLGLDWMTDRGAQKLREQWVLGRFAAITKDPRLVCASLGEAPDFVCYDAQQKSRTNVEVTEHLKQGRRRSDEYRKLQEASSLVIRDIEPPWMDPGWLKDAVNGKRTATYGTPALLLIYLNEGTYQAPEEWQEDLRKAAAACDLDNVRFDEVWVLDASGCTATRIKPVAS